MSRASVTPQGRRFAEKGMVDACTIRRVASAATDDFSGVITDTDQVVYSGKCRIQQRAPIAIRRDVGEDALLLLHLEIQLPMQGSAGLQVRDEVTIDSSVSDPDLPGRVLLIHALAHKTEATSRRVMCTERTG